MTQIQQLLFKCETDYLGHPYFLTGHGLYTAIAQQADAQTRRSLAVSHGQFVPGEWGRFPVGCTRAGESWKLTGELPPVETYADLFIFRDPAQRWLAAKRPRAINNTHDLCAHAGRLTFAPRCWVGRPPSVRNHKRTVQWYCHAYCHGETVPLEEDSLEGLQVGGGRNYGLGALTLVDTQLIELESLDYSRLAAADEYDLEILSPYVLSSQYPGADGQSVPWWWQPAGDLRHRRERLVDDGEVFDLETIDHGQVVRYVGDRPIETARNGITRVGTHARFGYGECRLRPATERRVPEQAQAGVA